MLMAEDPRKLIVLGFDSPLKAQEALLAATRLVTEGQILLHDAVFVAKDEDGTTRVTETIDESPGDAALSGGFWGMLFGTLLAGPVGTVVGGALSAGASALVAKLVDIGISDQAIAKLRETITPGTTALALLISHVHEKALLAELHRFAGAKLVATNLPDAAVAAVKQALEDGQPVPGAPAA
jgi:uncharacterized membrane protein